MSKNKSSKAKKGQMYERKEGYKPHEVLNFLPNPDDYPVGYRLNKVKKDYDGDLIKMGSDRYYTFAKSLVCCSCGLEGVVFYKERGMGKNGKPQNCGFHFNLYAIDENGEEVLMTKDHIIPKAKGGEDKLSNYQTMCVKCNKEKEDEDNEVFFIKKSIKSQPRSEMFFLSLGKDLQEFQSISRCSRENSETQPKIFYLQK